MSCAGLGRGYALGTRDREGGRHAQRGLMRQRGSQIRLRELRRACALGGVGGGAECFDGMLSSVSVRLQWASTHAVQVLLAMLVQTVVRSLSHWFKPSQSCSARGGLELIGKSWRAPALAQLSGAIFGSALLAGRCSCFGAFVVKRGARRGCLCGLSHSLEFVADGKGCIIRSSWGELCRKSSSCWTGLLIHLSSVAFKSAQCCSAMCVCRT